MPGAERTGITESSVPIKSKEICFTGTP